MDRTPHHDVLKDKDYNLVSTLHHALRGAETSGIYRMGAKSAGDEELQKYFCDAQEQYKALAERAKSLLTKRVQ